MHSLLQFMLIEPDKVFKYSRQKLLCVRDLKVGLHPFCANCLLEKELHGGESPAVSQAIGGILQIVCGYLRVYGKPGSADQVILTIAVRACHQYPGQIETIGGARQRRQKKNQK